MTESTASQRNGVIRKIFNVFSEVSNPKNDSLNPYHKSKYASLHSILSVIRSEFIKNDLFFSQTAQVSPAATSGEDLLVVSTKVYDHETGQSETFQYQSIIKEKSPQGVAAAFTYARRYAILGIFGLAQEDDDDDGLTASGVGVNGPTAEAIESLNKKAAEVKTKKGSL